MSRISTIIKREYITRIRNKSFIIMTVLGPVLYLAIMIIPILASKWDSDKKEWIVLDETAKIYSVFENDEETVYSPSTKSLLDIKNDMAKENPSIENLIYIPKDINYFNPEGIEIVSIKKVSPTSVRAIESSISKRLQELKYAQFGIDKAKSDSLKTKISVSVKQISQEGEQDNNSMVAYMVSLFSGILMYFFIFIYGSLVLRGIQEEKQNRVVELLLSSVKPFEMMMGKIIGIGLVGFTQFALWIIISIIISLVAGSVIGGGEMMSLMSSSPQNTQAMGDIANNSQMQSQISLAIASINIPLQLGSFFIYFIIGYFLYSAMFAAVAAAADSQEDLQQLMLPISLPIIFTMMFIGNISNNPDGNIALFLSLFPLSSPIAMVARINFGVPVWQLLLSISILIGSFFGVTWLSSKIYRVGILSYGNKITLKDLWKWLRY